MRRTIGAGFASVFNVQKKTTIVGMPEAHVGCVSQERLPGCLKRRVRTLSSESEQETISQVLSKPM